MNRDEPTLSDLPLIAMWMSDPAGACVFVSREWCEFTGQAPADALGFGWLDALHADDRDAALSRHRAAHAGGEPYALECRLRRHDGAWRRASVHSAPRVDDGGRTAGHLGCVLDVTERQRAEDALRASEHRYRSLAQSTASMIGIADASGAMREVWHWQEFTGQTDAEFRGLGFLDAVHPEDREATTLAWLEAVLDQKPVAAEFRVRHRDGSWCWVVGRGVPIFDEAGRLREWLGTMTDIDAAKRGEAELRESERRLRCIVDSNVIGMVFWDESGPITDANDAYLALVGRTREDVRAGRVRWTEHLAPGYEAASRQALDEMRRTGAMPPLEMEIVAVDGSTVPVLLAGTMLGQEPLHGVTWVLDISERRRAEREREQALADAESARAEAEAASRAKDRFLAMLGHELRNPLSAVRNAVVTARLDPSRSARALDTALRQSDRLTQLIDDLLDVARITHGRIALRRQPVHMSQVVAGALESTRAVIEDLGHQLVTSLPAPDLCVEADPARLEQVLVNLLSNAAKFTAPGGRIELSVERDGDAARIRVRDSGIGIAPELRERVFDAFAQADDSLDRGQSGLGLGLALVKGIVELHGGRVAVASEGLGRGSEFTLWLPALPALREDADAPAAPDPVPTARARIVLVEDNADAADSLVTLLEILGHRVRHFADGASALEAVAADPPDLMLIDVGLPGIDGYEVARRARQTPALGGAMLVALTGYGRDEDRARALAAGFDRHLVKPAPPHVLQALVAELQSRRGAVPDAAQKAW